MFFFFNDTATTEIYTLSLHDALPICVQMDRECTGAVDELRQHRESRAAPPAPDEFVGVVLEDRKSTRLNSSHANISYAVFCLKKKKNSEIEHPREIRYKYLNI